MKLIFLRHGIAEDRGNVEDSQRKLTPKGIKKLEEYLPFLAKYLENKEVEIWSSPKVRADETAQLLVKSLPDQEILYKDFIASGSLEELDAELSKAGDKTVVIVGHEPYLSAWTWDITGEDLVIKKGAALEIYYDPDNQDEDYLEWAFPLKEFEKILEREEKILKKLKNPSFKIALEKVLSEQFNKILENRAYYLRDNNDIESIHQYRVSIRKFRGIISSLKKLLKEEDYLRIQDTFRNLGGEAGYLRELDVLIEEYKPLSQEQDILLTQSLLLQELRKERRKEKERLKAIFMEEEYRLQLVDAYTDLLLSLPWNKIEKMKTKEYIIPAVDRWRKQILKGLEKYDKFDFPSTHKIRLKAKKFRYVAKSFEYYLPEEYQDYHKEAKKYQTLLGDTCDSIRNQEALVEIIQNPEGDLEKELDFFLGKEIEREKEFKEKLENKEWLNILEDEKETEEINEPVPEETPEDTVEEPPADEEPAEKTAENPPEGEKEVSEEEKNT